MKNKIHEYIQQYFRMNDHQRVLLDGILIEKQLVKQRHLIREGQIADSFYFVVEGTLRSYI